jgi:hypothetical protein
MCSATYFVSFRSNKSFIKLAEIKKESEFNALLQEMIEDLGECWKKSSENDHIVNLDDYTKIISKFEMYLPHKENSKFEDPSSLSEKQVSEKQVSEKQVFSKHTDHLSKKIMLLQKFLLE